MNRTISLCAQIDISPPPTVGGRHKLVNHRERSPSQVFQCEHHERSGTCVKSPTRRLEATAESTLDALRCAPSQGAVANKQTNWREAHSVSSQIARTASGQVFPQIPGLWFAVVSGFNNAGLFAGGTSTQWGERMGPPHLPSTLTEEGSPSCGQCGSGWTGSAHRESLDWGGKDKRNEWKRPQKKKFLSFWCLKHKRAY